MLAFIIATAELHALNAGAACGSKSATNLVVRRSQTTRKGLYVKKKSRRELATDIIARLREGLNRPPLNRQQPKPDRTTTAIPTAHNNRTPRPAQA